MVVGDCVRALPWKSWLKKADCSLLSLFDCFFVFGQQCSVTLQTGDEYYHPQVFQVSVKSLPSWWAILFKFLTDLTPLDQTDCCPAVAVFMHVWLFSTYQYSLFFLLTSATKWPVAAPFFARSQTDPVHRFADLGEIISFLLELKPF